MTDPLLDEFERRLKLQEAPTEDDIGAPQLPTSDPLMAEFERRLQAAGGPVTPGIAPDDTGILGEFTRGTRSGVYNVGTAATAVGALGGGEEITRYLQERMQYSQQHYQPAVGFEQAFDSVDEFSKWLAFSLGEQLPNIATIVVSGGAAGLLGKAIASGVISRTAAQAAGAYIAASGLETGSTVQEQLIATGELDPSIAIAAGMAKGALEAATPLAIGQAGRILGMEGGAFRNLILGVFDDPNLLTRIGKAGVKTGVLETATEATQEAIDVAARIAVDQNYANESEEIKDRIKESAITALFVGGGIGLMTGGLAPREGFTTPEDLAPARVMAEDVASVITPEVGERPTEGEPTPPAGPPEVPPGTPPSLYDTFGAEEAFTPLTDEQVLREHPVIQPYIASVPKTDVTKPQEFLEFEGFGRSSFTAALQGETGGTQESIFLSPREQLRQKDTSALVYHLPEDLDISDPSITFKNEKTAAAAFKMAKRAINLIQTGNIEKAREVYKRALKEGFRYKPADLQGFVVANEFVAEDIVPVTPPDFAIEEGATIVGPGVIYGSTIKGDIPITTTGHRIGASLPQRFVEDPKTPYYVDIPSVPIEQLSLGRIKDAFPNIRDVTPIQDVLQEVEQAVSENRVLFTKEDYGSQELSVDLLELLNADYEQARDITANILRKGARFYSETMQPQDVVIIGKIPSGAKIPLGKYPQFTFNREASDAGLGTDLGSLITQVVEREEYTNLTTFSGTPTTLDEVVAFTQEGTPSFLWREPADKTRLNPQYVNRARDVISNMVKKFAPEARVVVVFSQQSKEDYLGWHQASFENNVFFMELAVGQHTSMGQVLDTTVHEMGHLLSAYHLATLKKDNTQKRRVYDELLNAYHRSLYRAAQVNNLNPLMEFLSPANLYSRHFNKKRTAMLTAGIGDNTGNYLFSFEEWIANETSKYFLNVPEKRQVLGLTDTVLKSLADFLNKAFKWAKTTYGIKKPKELWNPSVEFQAFIDYTQAKDKDSFHLEETLAKYRAAEKIAVPELGVSVVPGEGTHLAVSAMKKPTFQAAIKKTENPEQVEKDLNIYGLANDYYNSVVKHGWTVLQLAWKNKHIAWLQKYVDTAEQWYNEKTQWLARANKTIRDWGSIGKEDADRLSAFIFDVDQMVYLSKEERQKKAWRQPTKEELQVLVQKHKINQGSFKLFLQIRDDLTAMLDRMESIVKENMRKSLDPKSATFLLEETRVSQEFAAMRARPYFPHARFGEWAIVVKDKNGKTAFMTQVEISTATGIATGIRGATPRIVEAERRRVQQEFPESAGFRVGIDRIPEAAKIYRGMPPSLLKNIRDHLGAQLSVDQQIWLDRLMVEMAPGQSFRKRLAKRENIPGYSMDTMRAYADYFWHGANHIARISYGHEMQQVINDGEKDTAALRNRGYNVGKRRQMLDFLNDHIEAILNPQPDWAQLRSFAFTWWLGFSPASAVLNFTQLPIATVPYLTARFGTVKGLDAMRSALFNIRKMYTDPESLYEKGRIPQADYKLLEIAFRQGFIEESLAMELAGVAEGSNLVRIRHGSKTQRMMTGFANAAGWLFQGSEKINRRVTFAAAVKLARENPNTEYLKELRQTMKDEFFNLTAVEGLNEVEAQAFLAGKDAIRRTQYEYASWARPSFMRGKKGVIFTFYMFTQNMLWSVRHNPGNTRMLLVMLAMGGLMGLPGGEDAEEVASYIGKKLFGTHFDLEYEIAQVVSEITGSNRAADFVLHGAAREGFGLAAAGDMVGLPIPKFDMSGAVGLGRVIPGVQELFGSGSFEERFARTTTDIAGASLGIGINMLKFLTDTTLPIDDMKRWERAVPRALKNVMRGMRYTPPNTSVAALTGNFVSPEGRERTRQGDTVIAFDGDNPEHMMEIAMQMAGFNPTRLSREWNSRIAAIEAVNYWKLRREQLYAHYWHSLYTGDKEGKRDVIKAIRRFNHEAPYPEMRITSDKLSDSIKRRKKIKAQRERGIEPTKMFRRLQRDIRETYTIPDDGITEEELPRS